MKVLFIAHGHNRFIYPPKKVSGGLERVELDQLASLARLGVQVTVVCPADSEVEGLSHVKAPTLSKESCSRMRQSDYFKWTVAEGLFDSHDVVLTNRQFAWYMNVSPAVFETLKQYAPKLRFINHDPPSDLLMGHPFVRRLQTYKFITHYGAKVATVMSDGPEIWGHLEHRLTSGKAFPKATTWINELLTHCPGPIFNSFYEVMVTSDHHLPLDCLVEPTTINFTGRPSNVKGLAAAVKSSAAAGMLARLVGNTCEPCMPQEQRTWEKLGELQAYFKVSRPYDEVIGDLAAAAILLHPSMSESAGGIVAFEAASHGVPVVTTTDTCRRFLEPYGLYHFIPNRKTETLSEAIRTVRTLTVSERRAIAAQVRQDYSEDAYDKQLLEFLS